MTIKVILHRKVPAGLEAKLLPLLVRLRALCLEENPGYIKGETLFSTDDASEVIVISTWSSMEDWNRWLQSEKRAIIQNEIDELIGFETHYQTYYQA